MNKEPRNSNVPGLLLLVLFALALVAACSGGNIDVAVGGISLPPGSIPPFPNSEPVAAQGTITGFGELTVNGTRYDADDASILVDSQPGVLSDLKTGHVVTLTGRISIAGFTGQASTIRMHSRITGPVETIDASNGRLTVMSQVIQVGPDTYYSADINPVTLDGLATGDRVRISGYADAAGDIRATRIEMIDTTLPLQVVGEVSGLDIARLVFDFNRLAVDYSNAVLIDLPDGAPANGMTVTVIGTLANGLFLAEQLTSGPALTGDSGERAQLGGIVTRFASMADFEVNDTPVTALTASTFINGDSSDLQLDARVTIDGEFDTAGKVRAEHITFGEVTSISVPAFFDISVTQGTGASALHYYGSNVTPDVLAGDDASLIWLGETRP